MDRKDYLKILKEEIHSTVFATVDENGLPVARVIDIMLTDDESIYFLTAKGKEFYRQLMDKKYVALSGMTHETGSLNKKAISIRGKVQNIGDKFLDKIFEENPYMAEIYPSVESRMALEVFKLYQGEGEYFDLSVKPIVRDSFVLGKVSKVEDEINDKAMNKLKHGGYFVSDKCRGCKMCYAKCPQKCIDIFSIPVVIKQENCLHCGNCKTICPFGAVERI